MLKLYGYDTINTLKILMLLFETGSDFEFIPINIRTGEQHSPDFRAVNPAGKVPVIWNGFIFLAERPTTATLACIVLSLLGLICMVSPYWWGPDNAGVPVWPVLAGLAGAFGSGVAYTLVRKLVATEHPSVIVLYFPLVCLPGTLLLGGGDFIWPTITGWWVLLGVGCFTQFGQLALTKAMQLDAASRVTSLSYVQIIFAAVLGWLFFGEIPTQTTFLGGGLILLGAVVSTWMQPRPTQPA